MREWIDSTCHPGSAAERDIGAAVDGIVRTVLRCTHPFCGREYADEPGFSPIEIRRQVRQVAASGGTGARSWWPEVRS